MKNQNQITILQFLYCGIGGIIKQFVLRNSIGAPSFERSATAALLLLALFAPINKVRAYELPALPSLSSTSSANQPAAVNRARSAKRAAHGVQIQQLLSPSINVSPAVHEAIIQPAAPLSNVVFENLEWDLTAPKQGESKNKVASGTLRLVLPPNSPEVIDINLFDGLITDVRCKSAEITPSSAGGKNTLTLKYKRSARKKSCTIELDVLMPVTQNGAEESLQLPLPDSLVKKLDLTLPGEDYDVTVPGAIKLTHTPHTTAHFAGSVCSRISWRPRSREVSNEAAVFFVETTASARCDSGVITIDHLLNYRIARGELSELNIQMPLGCTVTAVEAAGLGTWRFDPESGLLEALLLSPVHGDFKLNISAQVPRDSLPYSADIAMPTVKNASRQRGALALLTPDNIQVVIDSKDALYPMNPDDFPIRAPKGYQLKRAFRYQAPPATLTLSTSEVLPEIRVAESAALDVSDERIVLSSRLNINILKAGLFTLRLQLPKGYEIDSLSGEGIAHWDEQDDEIIIHYKNRMLGQQQLNLVVQRNEKGLEDEIDVPRILISDVRKHSGTLLVSAEKGLRLSSSERRGVSEINPNILGETDVGKLAFRTLRPDWAITLRSEVQPPVIRAEMLEEYDVSDGLLTAKATIRYTIEHAGCKTFLIHAPNPECKLSILGRDIAGIEKVDTNTLWRVNLHNKVQQNYRLECRFQQSFDPAKGLSTLSPLRLENVESAKTYLVLRAAERLQLNVLKAQDLRASNARGIPAVFGAENLADAVFSYKIAGQNPSLDLSVLRRQTADVLPARVNRVDISTVVTEDLQSATRTLISLQPGTLRFLPIEVPEQQSVWSVTIDGNSSAPLRRDKLLLIPLMNGSDETTELEIICGGTLPIPQRGIMHLQAPSIQLPLNNISWNCFLPPGLEYSDHDGSLTRRDASTLAPSSYNSDKYTRALKQEESRNRQLAETVLRKGERYAAAGKQREARQAFEAAMNYSRGDQAVNEDARIQFRNLAKNQVVMGLVNRRSTLSIDNNDVDADALSNVKQFNDGNWTPEFEQQIAQTLNQNDSKTLNAIAEKMIDQQAAAAVELLPIRVTIPEVGTKLHFTRDIQTQPGSPIFLEFNTHKNSSPLRGTLATSGLLVLLLAGTTLNRKMK